MKLQADAEHQQDDADLGKLLGQVDVGDEPGRVGSDGDAREKVADNRRQAGSLREVAEDERCGQAAGERQNEVERVH